MTELLKIEVYNDGVNTVSVAFRDLAVKVPKEGEPYIMIIFDQYHAGPAGNFTVPCTLFAKNDTKVPVFQVDAVSGEIVPVMIEPTPGLVEGDEGYQAPYQETIGEFDMWKVMLFENKMVTINEAITQGVKRKKGLITDPLVFVRPTAI